LRVAAVASSHVDILALEVADLSARDRKAVLDLLQAAQVAYSLTRFPKKQVLDGADDQGRLHASIAATRAAAANLSTALRNRTDINWSDLIGEAADGEAEWRIAKKVTPALFVELRPLLLDDPEAAFLPVPPMPKPKKIARAKARR
jgi:hypothetical protein